MIAVGIALVAVQLALAGWMAFAAEVRMRRRIEASHERERTVWQKQLDALAASIHYGATQREGVVIGENEPTAEEKATRAFGQEAIENGVRRLREEYAQLGVMSLSDDELRNEAISILFGASPVPSIPLLVRDGP